jgi:hypothetical protein
VNLEHPVDEVDDPEIGDPGTRIQARLVRAILPQARFRDLDDQYGA